MATKPTRPSPDANRHYEFSMIAMTEMVEVKKNVPSGTIVINRIERRNALSREIVERIRQALEDFHQERSVRAVILAGAGNTFCSGADLHEIKETSEQNDAQEMWYRDVTDFQDLIEYMLRFPKPIIAAVNGWVTGSGVAMMLGCDIVVASSSGRLAFPESQLGLISGIAAPLLAFRVGAGHAAHVLLSAKPVDAETCLRLGLFHEIVPEHLVWARANELAAQCAERSHQSQLMTKQILNETIGESLFTQLSIGAANTAAARTTEAAHEGINAFLEKRKPKWD